MYADLVLFFNAVSIAVSIISCFILIADYSTYGYLARDWRILLIPVVALWTFVGSTGWLVCAGQQPWRELRHQVAKPVDVPAANGGILQMASYVDVHGEQRIINVYDELHAIIPQGKSVGIVEHEAGPYCGLYYIRSSVPTTFRVED